MVNKSRRPSGINNVLEKVIKNLGITGQVKLVRIMTQWGKIFEPPISKMTFPRDLKGKTLFVDAENSVWLQQLSLMDKLMIEKINKGIGSKVINKIRFSVGQIPESPQVGQDKQEGFLDDIVLDNKDLDEIRECVAEVSDPELRKSLRRIMVKDKKLEKHREKISKRKLQTQ